MVARRGFCDDGDRKDGQDFGVCLRQQPSNNRRFTFTNVVRDVMNGRSMGEISDLLEPLLRRVVREEVERVTLHFLSSPSHQIEPARGRSLHLDFITKLPTTIFTNSRIEPEDGSPVTVILRDAATKAQISTGPLSSTKVEIVVLDGDFGADDMENWTEEQFSAKIVRQREGKRPLVAGDLTVTLRDGVGFAGDIVFTDNSSWIRSRKFRLGARVTQRITSGEVTVREARSEAFMVKDHRGELYKKHYPPSPADDVWRLDRIAKDGAFHKRLVRHHICTVRDFLRLYVTDQSALRNVLGNGVSTKIWETILDHALTCVADEDEDEMYTYYGSAHRVCLLFDSVYRVVAATFDGQNFMDLDKLTLSQKLAMEDTKRQAYKNIDGLTPLDRRATIGPSRPLVAQQPQIAIGQDLNLQELDLLPPHQDQFEVSLPQLGFFTPSLRNSFIMRELLPVPYTSDNAWSPTGTLQPPFLVANDDTAGTDDHHEPSFMQLSPWNTTTGQGNGFFFAANDEPQFGIMDRTRARWCKIRACVMFESVRRNVLAKRRRLMYVSY